MTGVAPGDVARVVRWLKPAAWALPLILAGCGEMLGPVPLRTAAVRGTITADGRPVTGGWVEFHPVEGTVGNLRSARIGPDGTFAADRVAVGRNAIGIVDAPIEPALNQVFHPSGSPIRRTITESGSPPLTIDLRHEAIRFQNARRSGR
jgi:hypothetical protein